MFKWTVIFFMVFSITALAQIADQPTGGGGGAGNPIKADSADVVTQTDSTVFKAESGIVLRPVTTAEWDTIGISVDGDDFYSFKAGEMPTAYDLIMIDPDDSLFFQTLFGMFRAGYVDTNATGDSVIVLFSDSTGKAIATDVNIDTLSGATYMSLQDYINITQGSALITGGLITVNGTDIITRDYQTRVRYERFMLDQQLQQIFASPVVC